MRVTDFHVRQRDGRDLNPRPTQEYQNGGRGEIKTRNSAVADKPCDAFMQYAMARLTF